MSEVLGFKNVYTMKWDALVTYAEELEGRVRNADKGVKMWRDELNAARAAQLSAQARAIAATDSERSNLLAVAGALRGVISTLEQGETVCMDWPEYRLLVKIVTAQAQEIIRGIHAVTGAPTESLLDREQPPSADDIPF